MQGHSYTRPLIISSGFPCQNASTANSVESNGIDGPATGLIFEALRIVDELEPEYLFLENVAGLVDRGRGWGRILNDLAERGFCIWWQIVSAAAFGFPFEGKRLLSVAFSPSLGVGLEEVAAFDCYFDQNAIEKKEQHVAGKIGSYLQPKNYNNFLAIDNGIPAQLVSLRLHAIGNSIQPIFSEIIFKTIKAFHETIIEGK